jgi:hypothetical protein
MRAEDQFFPLRLLTPTRMMKSTPNGLLTEPGHSGTFGNVFSVYAAFALLVCVLVVPHIHRGISSLESLATREACQRMISTRGERQA